MLRDKRFLTVLLTIILILGLAPVIVPRFVEMAKNDAQKRDEAVKYVGDCISKGGIIETETIQGKEYQFCKTYSNTFDWLDNCIKNGTTTITKDQGALGYSCVK